MKKNVPFKKLIDVDQISKDPFLRGLLAGTLLSAGMSMITPEQRKKMSVIMVELGKRAENLPEGPAKP